MCIRDSLTTGRPAVRIMENWEQSRARDFWLILEGTISFWRNPAAAVASEMEVTMRQVSLIFSTARCV